MKSLEAVRPVESPSMTQRQLLAFLEMEDLVANLRREIQERSITREDVRQLQEAVTLSQARMPENQGLEPVRRMAILMSQIMDFFQA